MASPFASVEEINPVLLTYHVAAAGGATDPLTGIEYGSTTDGVLTAYVKPIRGEDDPSSELARNPFSQRVKVYCITPMFLPKGVGQGSTLDYSFTEPTRVSMGEPERVTTGKLTITQFIPSPISVVNEELGDTFTGYLLLD